MTFWRDKAGNKLTRKEFFRRWGEGIEGITALQKVKMQMWSTLIMLIGIICGIVITCFAFKTTWWLTIILVGALFNVSIQMLSLYQQLNLLTKYTIGLDNEKEEIEYKEVNEK